MSLVLKRNNNNDGKAAYVQLTNISEQRVKEIFHKLTNLVDFVVYIE